MITALLIDRIEFMDDSGRLSMVYSSPGTIIHVQMGGPLQVFPKNVVRLGPPEPPKFDVKKAQGLSDKVLADAHDLLMGNGWKNGWPDVIKARDMRSILCGDVEVCVPFKKWVSVVNFVMGHIQ